MIYNCLIWIPNSQKIYFDRGTGFPDLYRKRQIDDATKFR